MGTDITRLGAGHECTSRRMDGMNGRNGLKNRTGSAAHEDTVEHSDSFRNVMENVASENKDAEKTTRTAMVEKKGRKTAPSEKEIIRDDHVQSDDDNEKSCNYCVTVTDADLFSFERDSGIEEVTEELLYVDEGQAQEASELINGVFSELSEVLGIQFFSMSEHISLEKISENTKSQFAEIVNVLRTMAGAMDMSVADGLPVEIPGKSVEGEELVKLTDTIKTAVFKMELACNVLGISESVADKIAAVSEGLDPSGIIQATDPASLSMSPQHIKRLFGTMFGGDGSAEGTESLLEKVRKLIGGDNEISASVQVTKGTVQDAAESGTFESRVYRALLKIDALQKVGDENTSAGEGAEKNVSLPEGQGVVLADAPGESLNQNDAGITGIEGIKPDQSSQMVTAKTVPDALMKMTEESVTKQVTDKLASIVRSGLNEVTIQLRPESLGEVRMRIRMEGDVVFAKIEVQNMQVKEIMERNFGALKNALEQHNITAGNFDVQVSGNNSRGGGHTHQQAWMDDEQDGSYGQSGREDRPHQEHDEDEYVRRSDTGRRFGDNSIEYFG